jgi:ferredoxin
MESKRQQKFAGVIQQDLATIFQREGNSYLPNTMVTITKVRVTPDLAIARIFLSFFNGNTQLALQTIKQHASESMVAQMDAEGFGNCTNTGACEAECPKEITLTNIARMNNDYFSAKFFHEEHAHENNG